MKINMCTKSDQYKKISLQLIFSIGTMKININKKLSDLIDYNQYPMLRAGIPPLGYHHQQCSQPQVPLGGDSRDCVCLESAQLVCDWGPSILPSLLCWPSYT